MRMKRKNNYIYFFEADIVLPRCVIEEAMLDVKDKKNPNVFVAACD